MVLADPCYFVRGHPAFSMLPIESECVQRAIFWTRWIIWRDTADLGRAFPPLD